MELQIDKLFQEVVFKATTSGGKGGQHVNKVATRVELYFDIRQSAMLNEEQKELLLHKLSHRSNADGVLRLVSSEKRGQLENKEAVKQKFTELIRKALTPQKKRVKTYRSQSSVEERLRLKKLQSERKRFRKQGMPNGD